MLYCIAIALMNMSDEHGKGICPGHMTLPTNSAYRNPTYPDLYNACSGSGSCGKPLRTTS